MLDIRYFCVENTDVDSTDNSPVDNELVGYHSQASQSAVANSPVETLPAPITILLKECNIGGIILFSENLINAPQIRQLTQDIQDCKADKNLPMLISIDQEGGRVARLPRETWPAFTGNMSIGALDNNAGNMASYDVGKAIGQQLKSLGINVNHAPTVDVNMNHKNPVINVRSFGDNAQRVSSLGQEMGKGMTDSGIIPTFKHFPGHGDTFVDSHTGLPCVNHNIETVNGIDLLPFRQAIDNDAVPMIMTAHIQYPVLDSTTLNTKTGETLIRPATLSPMILTDLLRHKLGYNGVVITDALDMASISQYFSPTVAIIETFKAGADIALMPFKIHTHSGIAAFYQLFKDVVAEIKKDPWLVNLVLQSFDRIKRLKKTLLPISQSNILSINTKAQQRQLERNIALGSLVKLASNGMLDCRNYHKICLIFPTKNQSQALANEVLKLANNTLKESDFECRDFSDYSLRNITINKNTLLIVGVEDKRSAVDLGGVDDLNKIKNQENSSSCRANSLDEASQLLFEHKQRGGESVFVSLKAPYNLSDYIKFSTCSLASFDGSTYTDDANQQTGPAFWALAQVLANNKTANGKLPISH